jgi:hypothetical protein
LQLQQCLLHVELWGDVDGAQFCSSISTTPRKKSFLLLVPSWKKSRWRLHSFKQWIRSTQVLDMGAWQQSIQKMVYFACVRNRNTSIYVGKGTNMYEDERWNCRICLIVMQFYSKKWDQEKYKSSFTFILEYAWYSCLICGQIGSSYKRGIRHICFTCLNKPRDYYTLSWSWVCNSNLGFPLFHVSTLEQWCSVSDETIQGIVSINISS